MAAANPAKLLQDELSCSLCHKYFIVPVSIHCGHSFCKLCITQFWGEQQTEFSCAQCGDKSLARELRPNRELETIVAISEQMTGETVESASREEMCQMHQKALNRFCENDGQLICPDCVESGDHENHGLLSAEDAAEKYRQLLQLSLRLLYKERKAALDFQTMKENKKKTFLEMVEGDKQKILSKCEEVQRFLKEQKKAKLDKLHELVKEQEEFTTRISREICVVDIIIHDMEEEYKQPASVFLKIMDGFLEMGFPHCIGVVDGTHMLICTPGGNPQEYRN